ncbi:MAG: prepilin-type N-terminal cleavage/methylation domain-containing protein [Proteobacteria bacterium]|nr:prepilin-type N-terminal cleavage/methylation domain-containing protein [Pseudomonadota bacterium]
MIYRGGTARTIRTVPARAHGFSLVELMVAVVVGLAVVLATLGFVVSVAQANSENIQVTRLTQELRAITEVMTRELRRARYTADPVSLIASGGTVNQDDINIIEAGENVQSGFTAFSSNQKSSN